MATISSGPITTRQDNGEHVINLYRFYLYALLKKNKSYYNTKSVKLQGYQSAHLGSTGDCESISPALVQMRVITSEMEGQK